MSSFVGVPNLLNACSMAGTVLGLQWWTKVPAFMEHTFYCKIDSKEMNNGVIYCQVMERAMD